MPKQHNFVEINTGNFTIPAGFVYCSIMNKGTSSVKLFISGSNQVDLPPNTAFDTIEDFDGYEAIEVQTNNNATSIYYKMK